MGADANARPARACLHSHAHTLTQLPQVTFWPAHPFEHAQTPTYMHIAQRPHSPMDFLTLKQNTFCVFALPYALLLVADGRNPPRTRRDPHTHARVRVPCTIDVSKGAIANVLEYAPSAWLRSPLEGIAAADR
eukprot:6177274-Pleurochrysis_carterae.AAC.1